MGMPFGRYFVFTGTLLLIALFAAEAYMPKLAAEPARAEVDRTTIRIHSQRQGPKAVVFDTSRPAVVAPIRAAADDAAPEKSPRDAFAMAVAEVPAKQPAARPIAPKRAAEKRRAKAVHAAPRRMANYQAPTFGNPWPVGW